MTESMCTRRCSMVRSGSQKCCGVKCQQLVRFFTRALSLFQVLRFHMVPILANLGRETHSFPRFTFPCPLAHQLPRGRGESLTPRLSKLPGLRSALPASMSCSSCQPPAPAAIAACSLLQPPCPTIAGMFHNTAVRMSDRSGRCCV